jgi:hypothetical protein
VSHSGHKIVKCSCGQIITQCRCMGPKPTVIIQNGCDRCKSTPPEPTVSSPDNAEDKLRIGDKVYDCLYEQNPFDIDVAKFLAALDRAGLVIGPKMTHRTFGDRPEDYPEWEASCE